MASEFRSLRAWLHRPHFNIAGGPPWWRLPALLVAGGVLGGLLIVPTAGRTGGRPGTATLQNPPPPQAPGLPGAQQPRLPPETAPQPGLSPKQKQELLKSGFEQMKKDSDQLLELARSLQKDVDKSNQNVLSVKVVDKAERIEKLAKKIKNMARGY